MSIFPFPTCHGTVLPHKYHFSLLELHVLVYQHSAPHTRILLLSFMLLLLIVLMIGCLKSQIVKVLMFMILYPVSITKAKLLYCAVSLS